MDPLYAVPVIHGTPSPFVEYLILLKLPVSVQWHWVIQRLSHLVTCFLVCPYYASLLVHILSS